MSAAENETQTAKSRVLLVDDHPIVRQGLTQLINAESDLIVSAEASSAREAMQKLEGALPDIVIVDISLEDRNGVELIKDIVARHPRLPCLALSMYDETMYGVRVLRAGGRGYVMKQEAPTKVVAAIRRVLQGHIYVSENMATRLVDQYVMTTNAPTSPTSELSDRELEVLTLIGRGLGTREIAEKLFLSVKTIEAHRERMKEKLKLKSGPELIRYAVQFTLDHQVE
ncbi:MAG: response regulator transcription factor [Phycisphaerae bacterium]|nr:response regulator transcription factor [Phycisphaerae bacterium]